MNTQTKHTGFTLIELLLYVGIVGTLLLAITTFFIMSSTVRVKNQTISEVDQQGQRIMDTITRTVRGATAISSPAAGGSGASLTLTVPTASLSPTVFDVSAGKLRIKEGTAAAINLSSDLVTVSNLSIKNLSRPSTSGIVQISFTIDRVNPSGTSQYSYQKTFISSVALRP